MDIILIEDVENLGLKYDIIKVKSGYARNFLIPNRLAHIATPQKKEELKKTLENQIKEEQVLIQKAKDIIENLKKNKIIITKKIGSSNKIFGSINNKTFAEELSKLGIDIDKKYIKIPAKNIKKIGKYTAKIRLHRSIEHECEFEVISENKNKI